MKNGPGRRKKEKKKGNGRKKQETMKNKIN